jgi:hypothetical protein
MARTLTGSKRGDHIRITAKGIAVKLAREAPP